MLLGPPIRYYGKRNPPIRYYGKRCRGPGSVAAGNCQRSCGCGILGALGALGPQELPEASLETLRGSLGRSWDALGALLGRSWDALGHSWDALGRSMRRSWGALGTLLGRSRALLGRSWTLNASLVGRFSRINLILYHQGALRQATFNGPGERQGALGQTTVSGPGES